MTTLQILQLNESLQKVNNGYFAVSSFTIETEKNTYKVKAIDSGLYTWSVYLSDINNKKNNLINDNLIFHSDLSSISEIINIISKKIS